MFSPSIRPMLLPPWPPQPMMTTFSFSLGDFDRRTAGSPRAAAPATTAPWMNPRRVTADDEKSGRVFMTGFRYNGRDGYRWEQAASVWGHTQSTSPLQP